MFCQKEENINSEICKDFSLNGPFKGDVDVLYIFYNLLTDSPLAYLPLIIAFIINFLSLKEFSKLFNSSMAKLLLIREKYSLFLKKIFLSSFKYIFLFPIIFLILYVGCLILGNLNFDISKYATSNIAIFPFTYLSLKSKFILLFLFNIIINSVIYVLLALITARITNSFYNNVILSYILYFILDIIGEVFIGLISIILLNIDPHSYFNFLDIFSFYDIPNYFIYLGVRLLVIFILGVTTYIIYYNKEKFIQFIERKWEILK